MRKFLATLSFIKHNPSLIHKYLIPDIKPATNLFKILHRGIFFVDFLKKKYLAQ